MVQAPGEPAVLLQIEGAVVRAPRGHNTGTVLHARGPADQSDPLRI